MLEEFIRQINERFPLQKRIFDDEKENKTLSFYIKMFKDVYKMNEDTIMDCYSMLVNDTLLESRYFYTHGGCYRHSKFSDVDALMRQKDAHYMQKYQVGILVSLFLWPAHRKMREHFTQTFSSKERRGKRYLEVGVGHGYYFSEAVSYSGYDSYLGIDINPDSLCMAEAVIKSRNECKTMNYKLELKNVFDINSNEKKIDAIVSGEVLEHVEEPDKFIRVFSELANENTFIYLTTAINVPMVDHIFLFKNPEEIQRLFDNNRLNILDMELYPYQDRPLEICLKKRLPVSVVITARKK